MIKSIIQPYTYLRSPDFHLRFKRWAWRTAAGSAILRYMVKKMYDTNTPHLEREVFGMKFSSPIGLAAGFDRNGDMIDAMAAAGFGFVEVGSITSRPQRNITKPALYELAEDKALLYRGQTDSAGVEQVIENIKRRQSKIVVGCNIVKSDLTSTEDAPLEYLRLFRPLYQYADYFTINIGYNSTTECYTPVDKDYVNSILTPLFEFRRGQNQYRPILLKISPDITDEQVDVMTDIMLETPLDGIVACGGTIGRHRIEKSTATIHSIGRTEGALCGKPLQNRAIEVVKRIYERAKGTYPIIGCGGVTSPDEAKAMLDAGATLVQIYSEFFYGGGDSLRNIQLGLNERLRKAELNTASATEPKAEPQQTAEQVEETNNND